MRFKPLQRGKYAPLSRYLASLPASQGTVALSVGQLEGLLGPCHQADALRIPAWDLARIQHALGKQAVFAVTYDRRQQRLVFTRRLPPQSPARAGVRPGRAAAW